MSHGTKALILGVVTGTLGAACGQALPLLVAVPACALLGFGASALESYLDPGRKP